MNSEEFMNMLERHDWYYAYSDDHRVWTKGREESDAIYKAMTDDVELRELYRNYKTEHGLA